MMGVESEASKTVQLQAAEVLSLLEIIDKNFSKGQLPVPRWLPNGALERVKDC